MADRFVAEKGKSGHLGHQDHGQRILVCDDEKNMRLLLKDILEDDGWIVSEAENGSQALAALNDATPPFPVMIVDLNMPGIDGFRVIQEARSRGVDTSIIVITAYATVDTAVRAMRAGATDFVVKPFDNDLVRTAARRCIETRELMTQVELRHPHFREETKIDDATPFPMIGRDRALKNVFLTIRRIADVNTAVLIQGESGTGKELVAQSIHYNGHRRDKPFVAVNCGALPESLLESEFFGHERGAFTGAHALQRGKFEIANGGTLFLDEIGEMPLNLQVKLLRVLQEQKFARVGGEKEIAVDVRIIAASNRNLEEEVAKRNFREDLFYRLNVIPIFLPPLRERKEDIRSLIDFFLKRFCRRHKLPPPEIGDAILESAMEREWPGNIRELQNAVEKAVILQDANVLTRPAAPIGRTETPERDTPAPVSEAPRADSTPPPTIDQCLVDLGPDGTIRDLSDVAAEAQRLAVIRALKLCNGNKAEAAKKLGVSVKTLYNRINELGISLSTKVE